ncbi:MAG: superoxide dismutase [Deltaproteobacteria bacterium]|nr:superoxide dismutase [Deltaproteobacteria bacterium]
MHNLPELPYAFDALEPHIDARTMEIHHGKHHAAYVSKLNAALENLGDEFKSMDITSLLKHLEAIPEAQRAAVRNNGGGHWNHSLFWEVMGPGAGGKPSGDLAAAIDASFGGFDAFVEKFENAAATRFGSGWAWLVAKKGGKLDVTSTPNQDNPVMSGDDVPVLGLDVWEHAYYLNYQNRRPDYIKAWWNVVNWDAVAKRFADASNKRRQRENAAFR